MTNSKAIIKEIILNGSAEEKKQLYGFDQDTPRKIIAKKFKLFSRGCYPRYFSKPSAPFHDDFISDMINSYFGENRLNAAYRGSAKTSLKKLFDVFVLLNDGSAYRKYLKVLSRDLANSKQIVTDVYNLIIEVRGIYGDVFESETDAKREETMSSFTTADGRKYKAGTVGQSQRGHLQDAYRPDWVWFEDTEDRVSIDSVAITQGTINRCEEAIDGLAKGGSYYVTCNYISDQGVVQYFMDKPSVKTRITPILFDSKDDTSTNWPIYTTDEIAAIRADCEDWWGEYQVDPRKANTRFFDSDKVVAYMARCIQQDRESAGVKYWGQYKPNHRYGQGSDHSEGVGLDSNTLVGFDFNDGEQVYSYANNKISPDLAAYEFARVGAEYGNCIYAPEINNKCGGTVITTLKSIPYPNIYSAVITNKKADVKTNKLGWETNSKTKYTMFHEFRKDFHDGLIKINDVDILKEMKAYANGDLSEDKLGLKTRHFDLLTACFVKGTLILTEKGQIPIEQIRAGDRVRTRKGFKKVAKTCTQYKEVVTNIGLTGTADHPVICNNNSIKDLSQISPSDNLYIWNPKNKKIERSLDITESTITAIPTLKEEHTGYIIKGGRNGKNRGYIYIGKCGWTIMARFLLGLLYITKMGTQTIITFLIFVLSPALSTLNNIWLKKKSKHCLDIIWQKIGTKLMRVFASIMQTSQLRALYVWFVALCLRGLPTMLNFVLEPVGMNSNIVREENLNKKRLVWSAKKSSFQVFPTKKGVRMSVPSLGGANRLQKVYNLEVESCHEYFANNVLVHNCVIAWQMRKYAEISKQNTLGTYNKQYDKYLESLLN